MFENLPEVHQVHSAAKYITTENTLKGVSVPLPWSLSLLQRNWIRYP